jgi:hypothetical protein
MGTQDQRPEDPIDTEMERHDPGSYVGAAGGANPRSAQDERPQDIRDPGNERADGRPTGETDEDGLRAGVPADEVSTEPAEDHGHRPTTEHAPGGDL